MKWSDGKPFTPADVVFTFGLMKKNAGLDSTGIWQHLKSVTARGRRSRSRSRRPDVPFAQQVASTLIVPQHVWAGVSDPTTFTNPDPVVTGPYVLDQFNPNQYTLKKNPGYWQAKNVSAEKLVFPALTGNQTSQLELSRGAYDWATLFIPSIKSTWVSKDPAHNQLLVPAGRHDTALPQPDGRRRSARSPSGRASPTRWTAARSPTRPRTATSRARARTACCLPNLSAWLDPSLPAQGDVPHSASKATAAFAKAGYHMKGGKLVGSDGKQVSFSLTTANGFTDWLQGAQVIQQQLKKAGIQVNLQTPQYAEYFSWLQNGTVRHRARRLRRHRQPVHRLQRAARLEAHGARRQVGGQQLRALEEREDRRAAHAVPRDDHEGQATARRRSGLQRIMYTQVPVVALFYGASWGEYRTKSFTGWPSAADPYAPPIPYNEAPLMVITHLKASGHRR